MLLAGRYTLLEHGGLAEFLPECVKRNVQGHGVELGAAAMQFPLLHPAVAAVIPDALAVREVKLLVPGAPTAN